MGLSVAIHCGRVVFFLHREKFDNGREVYASMVHLNVFNCPAIDTMKARLFQRRIPSRATIPLASNLGQVLYTHCLPSFSAPRNWGTKGSFRRLSGC